jgi:hypothetical protein
MPGNLTEPNGNWSGTAVETCLVGNSSQAGLNGTWAWADANCTSKFPFLCRINSELAAAGGNLPPVCHSRCCTHHLPDARPAARRACHARHPPPPRMQRD